jgi:leucyl-tRNA synthetase
LIAKFFPSFDPKHLVESEKEYPVSFNGKCVLPCVTFGFNQEQIEEIVMKDKEQSNNLTVKRQTR